MLNVHKITASFEEAIAEYCGATYCVCLDNCSNALFLALMHEKVEGMTIKIPSRTYMSVPCEILNAKAHVEFEKVERLTLTGMYYLKPTRIIDSALWFSADMYRPNTLMCLSFTGAYKTLKLGKGGAILTDDQKAYAWFKRKRFSGRREMSYHSEWFDMTGYNFYMNPIIATLGLQMMQQFYNIDGSKKHNDPITLPYPDLSRFPIYTQ